MASKTFYDCGCMEQGDQWFSCGKHKGIGDLVAEVKAIRTERVEVTLTDDAEHTVTMDEDLEKINAVYSRVLGFFKEHDAWSGESVMQRDDPQINAAPFLAELLDEVLKPKVVWK